MQIEPGGQQHLNSDFIGSHFKQLGKVVAKNHADFVIGGQIDMSPFSCIGELVHPIPIIIAAHAYAGQIDPFLAVHTGQISVALDMGVADICCTIAEDQNALKHI